LTGGSSEVVSTTSAFAGAAVGATLAGTFTAAAGGRADI